MWSPSCTAPFSSSSMYEGGGVSVRAGAIRGRGQCTSVAIGGGVSVRAGAIRGRGL